MVPGFYTFKHGDANSRRIIKATLASIEKMKIQIATFNLLLRIH
jgi:hypothetical protein